MQREISSHFAAKYVGVMTLLICRMYSFPTTRVMVMIVWSTWGIIVLIM